MRHVLAIVCLLCASACFAGDALDEVNAARARRGMPPFQRDATLSVGAENCAQYRAAHRIYGHVPGGMGDFQFLPRELWMGTTGGAGALAPSWGFQACAVFNRGQFAGAAAVLGRDGRLYCSIFVR